MSPTPFDAGPNEPTPWDLNKPFQPVDPVMIEGHMHLSGGAQVSAVAIPLDNSDRKHPGVMFRFAKPDGSGFYPPIVYTPDRVADLRALPALVEQAVARAAEVCQG